MKSHKLVLAYWRLRKSIWPRRPSLLVAAMPKSASTFVATVLANLTGFRYRGLVWTWSRNEQDLFLPRVVDAYFHGTVHQQHVRATPGNLELMNRFRIEPVVLTRNLFDIVVSVRDHFHREDNQWPMMYADRSFYDLDPEVQLDSIIDMALPWFFDFFLSWKRAEREALIRTMWLRYEDFVEDRVAAFKEIGAYYGFRYSDAQIEAAMAKATGQKTRINKGVVGRGAAVLTEAQKQRVRGWTRYYPHVDFGEVGL